MTDAAETARRSAKELIAALVRTGSTMATAESLTGGLGAYHLVDVPDAGKVMLGSVVAYATEHKRRLLGVRTDRVISHDCALEMVEGVQRMFGSTCALAYTGVAGPDTQEGQPVGTVFIGVACGDQRVATRHQFTGSPNEIRYQALACGATTLAAMVADALSSEADCHTSVRGT